MENRRTNENGRDLNRSFNNNKVPHIRAWHRAVQPWNFRLALTLHEDYDARGLYAYEISHREKLLTPDFMEAAAAHIPRDLRGTIEGMKASRGIIMRRTIDTSRLPGYPEAFVLHCDHALTTITFETPSEFGLYERVQAHIAFLNAAAAYLDQHPHD